MISSTRTPITRRAAPEVVSPDLCVSRVSCNCYCPRSDSVRIGPHRVIHHLLSFVPSPTDSWFSGGITCFNDVVCGSNYRTIAYSPSVPLTTCGQLPDVKPDCWDDAWAARDRFRLAGRIIHVSLSGIERVLMREVDEGVLQSGVLQSG